MTDRARAAVVAAIRDHGPITFAEFMEHALYGSGGYYEQPPVGPSGDYVTSPHVHEIFGALLGRGIRELWDCLARPDPFAVVDVGSGDGTLAAQLARELADLPVDYTAVETSEPARERLAGVDGIRFVTAELPDSAHVVLAHELLDNLPFRVLRGANEVRVDIVDDRLVEVESPADDSLRHFVSETDAAPEVMVPVGALTLVDRVAAMLRPGYAVIIDYGAEGSAGGSRHGYRAHRVVENVVADPGDSDVTVGVDFAVIAGRAVAAGLRAHPTVSQAHALSALGLQAWLLEARTRQQWALEDGRGAEAVGIWSSRSRATLLVDPSGLGRHRWLLLSSTGLPPPSWLSDSTSMSRRNPV
jgi:SAM-dependent MidA family methyltransferase